MSGRRACGYFGIGGQGTEIRQTSTASTLGKVTSFHVAVVCLHGTWDGRVISPVFVAAKGIIYVSYDSRCSGNHSSRPRLVVTQSRSAYVATKHTRTFDCLSRIPTWFCVRRVYLCQPLYCF